MLCRSLALFALMAIFSCSPLLGQQQEIRYNENLQTPSWVEFRHQLPLVSNWEAILLKLSGQSEKTTWEIYSQLRDELGQTHFRLNQYFQGVELESGTGILHTFNQNILAFNGEIIPENKLQGKVVMDVSLARSVALDYIDATNYYWQDEAQNQILRDLTGIADTSWFPQGKLVYCPLDLDYINIHRLTYKFNIYASDPLIGKSIFVDAETGSIIATEDLILHTDVKGTAVTKYSGTRSVDTDSTGTSNYRLREKVRGNGIETLNMKKGTSYAAAVDFTDSNNYWNNFNANLDEIATDAHWGAEKTYDFFDTILGRKSFDNNNAKILSYVHYSNNYANAFWNGSYMTYGDGNGTSWRPLTSIDVCGHEISHAVTTYSANLVYSYESGALNESFSDIFGNAIERWARPSKFNWKMGEDFTTSGNGIRDMANPNPYNHPKYYKGNRWYTGTADNGGVHSNSGVQNYWFYLIADGISGTNEKNDKFKIDSLGLIDASKIAYRNLTVYLTKNSQYADARLYSIKAAGDLFGQCSKHVIAVTNAWWACGVGAKYDSAFAKADFKGDTSACSYKDKINFTNLSTNYKSCVWQFGDGKSSSLFNPAHTYNAYGIYSVKLKVLSCFKGKQDSIVRINYVKIDSTSDICNSAIMPMQGTDSIAKCKGFIYDDGGEGNYGPLKQINLKVLMQGSDSVRLRFLVLDYEKGYDSVVLFKNNTLQVNKIGRFTGNVLPFGGAWITVQANSLWLRQYSDPLVEGKGFKIEFESFRKPLTLDLGPDTVICAGDSVSLNPIISGGYAPDYLYQWNTGSIAPFLNAKPKSSGMFHLTLRDVCTGKWIKDSVYITVRPALNVKLNNDTTICLGNTVQVKANPSGGLATNYTLKWDNGLGGAASHNVKPSITTTYRVILSDGCTVDPDTASITIKVKAPLKVQISTTANIVCVGKNVSLTAIGSGGDTLGYKFTWNQGLGIGAQKTVTLTDTTTYSVTLTDFCSVTASKDSLQILTYPPLQITMPKDTIICRGSLVNLIPMVKGGLGAGYTFQWNSGESTKNISQSPTTPRFFTLTMRDGCSPNVRDSVYVDLLNPLKISKQRDTTLCDGQTLTLNLSASGGRNASYAINWNSPGINGFNPILNPNTGSVLYQAILSDACTKKNDTLQFTITKLPPLSATVLIKPTIICAGDSVKMDFNFSGGKPLNYSWTLNGTPVTFKAKKIAPLNSTTYDVVLSDGCSVPSLTSQNVTVSAAASANLLVDKKLICANQPVTFSYTSPDAAELKWLFSSGDSLTGTGLSIIKVFPGAGIFTAKARLTTSNGCTGLLFLKDSIVAVNYPKAGFTPTPDISDFENPLIVFKDQSTGGTNHFWVFGDGATGSTGGDQFHWYPTDTGTYFVTQIVSIPPGCYDTALRIVKIKDIFRLHIPNAFSPDENNLNDQYLPVGRGLKTFHMTIYNRWGERLFESHDKFKGWNGRDTFGNECASGVYLVYIEVVDIEGVRHINKNSILLIR